MARTRDQESYENARNELLAIGELLIRKNSYSKVGINDILKAASVPKGSFYHYFENKEDFLIGVANYYHAKQLVGAKAILRDETIPALTRLHDFFIVAMSEMKSRKYGEGCLMCNLTTELADENETIQSILAQHWIELSNEIAQCLKGQSLEEIGLSHLNEIDAADFLLNSWSGALTRMKANANEMPLTLFIKSLFGREDI